VRRPELTGPTRLDSRLDQQCFWHPGAMTQVWITKTGNQMARADLIGELDTFSSSIIARVSGADPPITLGIARGGGRTRLEDMIHLQRQIIAKLERDQPEILLSLGQVDESLNIHWTRYSS